ncbi:MAG TPA: GDSL-type esterase/lipase family protein [Vicinamibacteria bacterium]|nr:GDSL-type esterase/lipase family protein [Vicinamibacteria bacterium]
MIRALARRFPRLQRMLPAALLAASWQGCARGEGPLVAFLGDSLTSGWRLSQEQAYPALVARALAARGRPVRVINAGRSGDTVAQGLARLPQVLQRRPDVLVVALGVNDALRGLPAGAAEAALRRIVAEARQAGARVILVGVGGPRTADARLRAFASIHARVAAEERVPLVADLLDGVGGHAERLFGDGLHPNAAGQQQLAENVRPTLELVLAEIAAAPR